MFLENLFTVLRILTPLFLLILLGAVLKRKNVIPPSAIPVLNGLVVYVTLPALVVLALAKAPELPADYARATLCFFAAGMGTMLIAYILGRLFRLPRTIHGALIMTAAFGNTSFLGYPITLARPVVADIFPAAVLLDQFAMTLPMYLCIVLVSGAFGGASQTHPGSGLPKNEGTAKSLIRFFRGPVFVSIVLGLMARLIPWPSTLLQNMSLQAVGNITGQTLAYLGQGTTPIVLLAFGAALRPGAVRSYPLPIALSCGLKLLVTPLLTWLFCHLAGLPNNLIALGVQMGAMPTAVMCSVLCVQNSLEGDMAIAIVFASTVLSAITVPLALSLLH
ncbi:MAG: AEC family transporter [Armatimonadota bacterium]